MPIWFYMTRPSNLACHNLMENSSLRPPTNWRSLLGLGLNFCPRQRWTNHGLRDCEKRFTKDILNKTLYVRSEEEDEDFDPTLYVRSNNDPMRQRHKAPPQLLRRVRTLFQELRKHFKKRNSPSNLLNHQRNCLQALRENEDVLVLPSDKNLGPCIMTRKDYTAHVWRDHLGDDETYQPLTKRLAIEKLQQTQDKILKWLKKYKDAIPENERKFIKRSTQLKTDDEYNFPHFYITAKVHKKELKTRPIVSNSGSLLEGLGKWIDRKLQPFGQATPSFIKSSADLLEQARNEPRAPEHTRQFTMDAQSMYTNIDTSTTLDLLRDHIPEEVLAALEIVMKNMVFQFSDWYFLQKNGTAMGTPPACMWATLAFSEHETNCTTEYSEYILFYRRYIDDGYGWWNWTGTQACFDAWRAFQMKWNDFPGLEWDFEEPSKRCNFLDLSLYFRNGRLESTLYEKAMNLYLYLPPHSSHPPGVIKGLIAGMVYRIFRLTTEAGNRKEHLQRFFTRLVARGHLPDRIKPIFDTCIRRRLANTPSNTTQRNKEKSNPVFLHLTYHPLDPPSKVIQKLFHKHVLMPDSKNPYQKPLAELENKEGKATGIDRLIVCYHRPPNLGNMLSPRKFDSRPGPSISEMYPGRSRRRWGG